MKLMGMVESKRKLGILGISIFSVLLLVTGLASAIDSTDSESFVPNFVVPNLATIATAHGDWQRISPDTVAISSDSPNTTELSLDTVGNLPPNGKVIFGGFCWLYEDGLSGYCTTSHAGVRDSIQRPDGWHQHNVVIVPANSGSSSHCIVEIDDDSHGGTAINGLSLRVITQNSSFDGTFMDPPVAISFDIIPDPSCPDLTAAPDSGVGIGIHQVEPEPVAAAAEEEEEKKGGGGGGGNPNK